MGTDRLEANDEEFTVNDRSTELEVLYIDDLVEGMFDLLEGKEQRCEFDGVETVLDSNAAKWVHPSCPFANNSRPNAVL